MRVCFRTDANKSIGMGHVMRCLSLADVCNYYGYKVLFLIADDDPLELITSRGYEAIVLHSDYQKMYEEEWPKNIESDIVFVDSYYVTKNYLISLKSKINQYGGKLAYIDDVYAFPYPVDILVNYNVYASSKRYDILYENAIDIPDLILGPAYAPLRSMFRNIPPKKQKQKVNNILMSTGGADKLHLSMAILRYILENNNVDSDNKIYHFLLGGMNVDKYEIRRIASNHKNIVIHENVTDMKSLINSVGIVVSSAGSTLYEIAACGVPLIVYSMADNQISGAEEFERLGIGINVGDIRDANQFDINPVISDTINTCVVARIMNAVKKLSNDYQCRCRMATKMQRLVDGHGAERIINKVLR